MEFRNSVGRVDVLILENNNIPHLPSRAFGTFALQYQTLEIDLRLNWAIVHAHCPTAQLLFLKSLGLLRDFLCLSTVISSKKTVIGESSHPFARCYVPGSVWASRICIRIYYTVKKGSRVSRLQPGCH